MNLINLIVKTLDGRNHDFTVHDNITVLQFKSIINEKMDIAVDRQRLLFQGRVLQDDNLLSSYNVAGNVMHLVTRPPPSQNRPQPEPTIEREENSDINRDQIRNILSDVFGNIADLSNPLGVSVNNEGNRVDITVNMPSTNRLSLARLRQNYIHRLMNQARELIQNLRDPSYPAPRPDRDRLYQANAYDLGQNEERITEVTAQPLPIHNLADMVHSVRDLWREAEPQLELWESVLRRQNVPEPIASSDREMQHLHDSASRYIHLFSHMLHIMSDYLVEFQQNSNSRITVPRNVVDTAAPTTEAATSTSIDENIPPLTRGFGESALPHTDSTGTSDTSASATADSNTDRSRYLYVFSEMPAQLLQVRLDVDSTIQVPAHGPNPGASVHPRPQAPRSTESRTAQVPTDVPSHTTSEPAAVPPATETLGTRSRRRENQFSFPSMENLFRTTLQDSFVNSSPRMNGASPRSIRSGSQLIENVDPYVRCQSRHFQNPSSLRSGAVLSTFGGIRLRESSRTRARPAEVPPTFTDNNVNTAATSTAGNTGTETRDTGDPIRSFIGGFINSIFSSSGDNNSTTIVNEITTIPPSNISTTSSVTSTDNIPTETNNMQGQASIIQSNDITRFLQSMVSVGAGRLDRPLGQLFPEILSGHDIENNITNKIIQLVVNRLTMIDFTQIIHGSYQPLNTLRIPLQTLLQRHQQECAGSRDRMLEHVVADLEFFNRVYMSIFDRLRSTESVSGLSDEARNNFNTRIDIPRTINNLNRHHARVVVDMILRSPTDIGFGQLLMNSMFSHHNESLALLDIICNNNDELRQYMVRAFFECLVSSMDESPDNLSQFINQSRTTFGLDRIFGNVNSRLFRRPEQLSELREIVLASYVVFIDVDQEGENGSACTVDHVMTNSDCLEEMVNSLSGNMATVLPPDTEVMMDITTGAHTANGGPHATWQAVLPHDWLDIVARDANAPVEQHTIGIPYSDAYVSGMPPKRRKVILNQRHRAVQPVSEMMHDCIDQAIRAAGITTDSIHHQNIGTFSAGLNASFQDIVADHVRNRLVDESFNFPADRFPSVEQNFQRKKRSDEDKKNN